MDFLKLSTSWDKKSLVSIDEKVTATLKGIYIQGAKMNSTGTGLEECDEETPSWNPVPPCFLTWILDEKVNLKKKCYIVIKGWAF